MTSRFAVALGATFAILTAVPAAIAGGHGEGSQVRRLLLPPVSGTIAMPEGAFGRGGAVGTRPWQSQGSGWHRPTAGSASGYDGGRFYARSPGYATSPRYRTGYGSSAPARGFGWTSGGTGLVGLIGDGGNPFAGAGTRWGTADSATTGGGFYRYGGDSARFGYGEPDLWTNASYGAPPRLATYMSGAPYSMAYYSSGSSAGPYGSPGGLGVYSSGAYGPGPRVIVIGRHAHGGAWRQGCTCGPRIIHVGQRHRHLARR